MTAPTAAALPPRPAAILSPIIDLLCVGGLSVVVLVPLLLFGGEELGFVGIGAVVWAQLLVNMSHFMASYRIVYRDREMIRRHKWAAIWVPLILIGFAGLALVEARESEQPILLLLFFVVSSGYLAWHYTGQVWGMMASFAWLAGTGFDALERKLIRGSLRILLVWHVTWFLNFWLSRTASPLGEPVGLIYQGATAASALAFVLGTVGLLRMARRTGKLPPLRAVVPWLAIFVWYAAILRWGLTGLFLVQLAHAIQYLGFPARVELNRITAIAAGRAAGRMALYAVGLLVVSFLVTLMVPGPPMSILASSLGVEPGRVAPILIFYFINIHHYFTDGVIWKISNPEVRRELFAHVAQDGKDGRTVGRQVGKRQGGKVARRQGGGGKTQGRKDAKRK
ncbi:MAG TPA: hypothetical protein VLB00_06920 [Gemmatimonadales bacterium]|nr:hypothetical protein [Gemmatimonadales bacterium]